MSTIINYIESMKKKYLVKAAGTCKQGERSDLTGCTPADGQGGGRNTQSSSSDKTEPDAKKQTKQPTGDPANRTRKQLMIDAANAGYFTANDAESDEQMTDDDWENAADEDGLTGEAREIYLAAAKKSYKNTLEEKPARLEGEEAGYITATERGDDPIMSKYEAASLILERMKDSPSLDHLKTRRQKVAFARGFVNEYMRGIKESTDTVE